MHSRFTVVASGQWSVGQSLASIAPMGDFSLAVSPVFLATRSVSQSLSQSVSQSVS